MNESAGLTFNESKPPYWLSEERFLKLHLELTILAIAQVKQRDLAEDIASQCLIDTWMTTPPGDHSIPVKVILLHRLADLIECLKKSNERQVTAGRAFLRFQTDELLSDRAISETLSSIYKWIPFLEPLEQRTLQLTIEEGLDLSQIALRLQLPFRKVKKLYKHSIFRLRKKLGLWKLN